MTDPTTKQLREIDKLLDDYGGVMDADLRAEHERRRAALRAARDVATCAAVPVQLGFVLEEVPHGR